MAARLPLTVRIGLSLTLLPTTCLGGWACWAFTRNWTPLNVPVSLYRGRIRTPEFWINMKSRYSIEIRTGSDSVVRASWSLLNDGKVVASGENGPGQPQLLAIGGFPVQGKFNADIGQYSLNLDIPEDERFPNPYQPRLMVFEDGGTYFASSALGYYALLVFLMCAPVGACMIACSMIASRQAKHDAFVRSHSLTHPGPAWNGPPWDGHSQSQAARRTDPCSVSSHSRRKPKSAITWAFSKPSTYSLIAALTYLVIWVSLVVVLSLRHVTATGLPVRLVRSGDTAQRIPGIQPLRLRVGADGHSAHPSIYVDSQLITWEDFSTFLQKRLSRRPPDWPVYVEADPDVEWRYVLEAVDAVRGLRVEVALLTPETRRSLHEVPGDVARGRDGPKR
jgi:biopolymer transport protein ExbD